MKTSLEVLDFQFPESRLLSNASASVEREEKENMEGLPPGAQTQEGQTESAPPMTVGEENNGSSFV